MNNFSALSQLVRVFALVIVCAAPAAFATDSTNYISIDEPIALKPVTTAGLTKLNASVVLIPQVWDQQTLYYFSETALVRSTLTEVSKNKFEYLANLPENFQSHSATLHGNFIYGLTTGDLPNLVRYDLSQTKEKWEIVEPLSSIVASDASLVISNTSVYIADKLAFYSYNLAEQKWYQRAKPPAQFSHDMGMPVGNSHLLFIDKSRTDLNLLAYHSITDKWVNFGELPIRDTIVSANASGNKLSVLTTQGIIVGEAILVTTNYSNLDHLVVIALVALLIAVGYLFSRKEKTSADYFKGDSKIPWWAASLSIFATNSSAITLMAMPSMAFSSNWIYFSITLFLVSIQVPLFVYVFVPIIRRLNMATANQYLEARFGVSVRMLGFIGFSLNQLLGRMAAILLLPATAISAIFGLPMEYSILIMGVSATIFVTMGGLSAVIWTDVLQAGIMIIAVFMCAFFALSALEFPMNMATEILVDREKQKMFDFRIDLAAPVVIVLLLNALATSLTYIGDQNFVQRVQCTSSEKESNKAVVSQLFVALPLNFILFSLGSVLFLYYLTRPDELPPALSSDGILPYFAAQTLPAGLAGIVVVALLAATISTVSSAMNSVANLCVDDIYRRFNPKVTDKKAVKLGRYITIALGVIGTGAALVLANLSSLQSIWDLFLMITGMLLAPITGIFMLGVFTKKANIYGVWAGAAASIFANYYAMFQMNVHALVYLVAGVVSCVVVGYLVSLLSSSKAQNIDGLTIYTLVKRKV